MKVLKLFILKFPDLQEKDTKILSRWRVGTTGVITQYLRRDHMQEAEKWQVSDEHKEGLFTHKRNYRYLPDCTQWTITHNQKEFQRSLNACL